MEPVYRAPRGPTKTSRNNSFALKNLTITLIGKAARWTGRKTEDGWLSVLTDLLFLPVAIALYIALK
jgi:hypothetical protein